MSDQPKPKEWTRRLFKYDDKIFDTVPDSMSIEEAKKQLAMYLPELTNAIFKEEINDGVLTVTFHKQATTKGNFDLIEALSGLEPIENPNETLFALVNEQPITLELLESHNDLIQTAARFVGQHHILNQTISACIQLAPIPAPFVPIGF